MPDKDKAPGPLDKQYKVTVSSFGGYYGGDILSGDELVRIVIDEQNLASRIALGALAEYSPDEEVVAAEAQSSISEQFGLNQQKEADLTNEQKALLDVQP